MADLNRDEHTGIGVQDPDSDQAQETPQAAGEAALNESEASELDVLRASLEELRAERDEAHDRYLRQAAEFQNFRRRVAQDREAFLEAGKALVIERILDVVDDMERSLGAVADLEGQETAPAYDALKQGVELVYRKLVGELSRLDVQPIEAVGQPFDENLHDAMMQQPAPDGVAPGTVVAEIQKGYRMGDRILRHSKVVVATEGASA
ncbi:MAG TPA: nucleotide exchange factor GrpE [Rhodothermales bacterium]